MLRCRCVVVLDAALYAALSLRCGIHCSVGCCVVMLRCRCVVAALSLRCDAALPLRFGIGCCVVAAL